MNDENLSDKGEGVLQPEIRERLLKEYLMTGYKAESKQHEIMIDSVTYKVLERREATAFYDSFGNTLFNISNEQLKSDYESMLRQDIQTCVMMKQIKGTDLPCYGGLGDKCSFCERLIVEHDSADNREEDNKEDNDNDAEKENPDTSKEETAAEVADSQKEDGRPAKLVAKEKLEKELKGAKDKNFAEPIIGYLLKRCDEDEGVAEDVAQEHKTWDKCFDYIYEQARKQATGNRAAVRDDVVYEWAEDYYHKDDKAEEAEKAKKEAEAKAKREKAAAKSKPAKTATKPSTDRNKSKVPVKEEKPKKQPKPKKSGKDMEGQLDIFSMMGM